MRLWREHVDMNVVDVLPRDAIPSIDEPTFGEAYVGDPDDEVLVVEADPPRAYPVRVLSHHEIVNDSLDGRAGTAAGADERPIAVTWCPICWSGAVYDRVVDGRLLTFGVSGKLADDALVMYDRETGTEWKQPTGEAIAGDLAGHRLEVLAAGLVTYERFRADNPEGLVLQPARTGDGGQSLHETYDMAGYEAYRERDAFGLYGMRGQGEPRSWDREDIGAKTLVLGVERDGAAVGYPVPEIEKAGGVVTDRAGETGVVVFASTDGVHAFENPGYAFEREEGVVRADGTTWDPVTGGSGDGRTLERIPAVVLFAFAWQDAHGPDAFFFHDGTSRRR